MTLVVSPEIRDAVAEGEPVVALETTIVSHGMPWPENIETALAVEDVVRENGAVPATIAVMDGEIRVGLGQEELERLGAAKDVVKASGRDHTATPAPATYQEGWGTSTPRPARSA